MLGDKKNSLSFKVIGSAGLAFVITVAIVAIIAYNTASNSLVKQAYNQLEAVQEIKKGQIESYFSERIGDITVLAENDTVRMDMHAFEEAFIKDNKNVNGPNWKEAERNYTRWLKLYKEEYGYYDLFLISLEGDVLYTVEKESDLGANLISGSLKNSPLGKCFKNALNGVAIQDFEPYEPSSNLPCAFVGAPVKENGRSIGVVALQLPLKAINTIMQERAGMMTTGETYLVGNDKLMRSDSYLDPTGHSVKASFAGTVEANGVDTEAVREGLAGRGGQRIITDYNGHSVLSAWDPLKIAGLQWVVLAEIDESEIMQPVSDLRNYIMIFSSIIIVIALFGLAYIIRKLVIAPINHLKEISGFIAQGDYTKNVNYTAKDEMGELAESFNTFIDSSNEMIANVILSAQNLSQAVEQIASGNQNLSQRTSEQASSLEEIASTIEETTATINQNAENAQNANSEAQKTTGMADEGAKVVTEAVNSINEINQSSKKIGEIISMINEISFQTNLLALNAAVEAARAGEQGRGFAVVAGEVRNLAQRSASAAKEIGVLIQDSIDKIERGTELVNKSGEALKEITGSVTGVGQIIGEIAAASQEQKQGIGQVNTAVGEMDTMTQQNAALVEETASASEEMANQAQELMNMVEKFKVKETAGRMQNRKMIHLNTRGAQKKEAAPARRKDDRTEEKTKIHQLASESQKEKQDFNQIMKEEGFEEF